MGSILDTSTPISELKMRILILSFGRTPAFLGGKWGWGSWKRLKICKNLQKLMSNLQKTGVGHAKKLEKELKLLNFLEERRLDPSLRWDKRGLRCATKVGGKMGKLGEMGVNHEGAKTRIFLIADCTEHAG